MYITKTFAMPTFEITDCIKIVDVRDYDGNSPLYETLKHIFRRRIKEFDISDDELLTYICIHEGLFTFKDWQKLINEEIKAVSEIDYEVDSTKRRLNLTETVYQLSGSCGRVVAGGYKMISALKGRDLVLANIEKFEAIFGMHPRDYIVKVWQELDTLLNEGVIVGEYTHELHDIKYPKKS